MVEMNILQKSGRLWIASACSAVLISLQRCNVPQPAARLAFADATEPIARRLAIASRKTRTIFVLQSPEERFMRRDLLLPVFVDCHEGLAEAGRFSGCGPSLVTGGVGFVCHSTTCCRSLRRWNVAVLLRRGLPYGGFSFRIDRQITSRLRFSKSVGSGYRGRYVLVDFSWTEQRRSLHLLRLF
jgi:hypothetical protein